MKTLDELATAAVDELHQQAAGAAQTDAMLAELRRGETLLPTVPTPMKDRGGRRVLVIGAAAAACVALIAGLTLLRGSDSRVRPVDGGSTEVSVTVPTPTSAPVSKAMFAAPIRDITTDSEIVYQFREQTIDCGQGDTCASGLLAPMVTTDNRIVIGDALRHRWLVATDEGTDTVEFDASWALLDAAMAPDNSVFAVFAISGNAVLYRYADATMAAPQEADPPRALEDCCTPYLFLDLGGQAGGSLDFVEYSGGAFVVHRPAGLARPSLTLDDATLTNEVLVEFTDGVQHTYSVGTGGNGRLLDGTLHSLTGRAVVVQQTDGVNTQRLLTVLLHDGSTFERAVPWMASAAVNAQRFVDEGYLYELTAVPVLGQPQWFDYAVRRWALPNEATTLPATTVPPPDTGAATPTTPAPTVPGLVTGHSIDGAAFGDEVDSALAVLTAVFGQPHSDETTELPLRVGQHWENDQYESFGNEHARQVCWQPTSSSPLCVWFGSDGNDPLRLVGWSAGTASINGVSIAAASGLTIGSKWSDHLVEVVLPPGSNCYNTGYAHTADGMNVELWSGSEMFVTIDSSGVISQNNPSPDKVVVGRLSAGDELSDTRSDC